MSSKKTKLLESAQKNFLKGQYDRAALDYRQLIQLDPSDVRHRQRLAEILAKANQKDDAINEYTSLAKIYIDTVHYLKAIAVYKQIQKLDPANPEISLTLASLNEKQGLNGNAVAEYSAAIQIFEKNGENRKAIKALESILTIDPKNSAVRLKLAEKYFISGNEKQSADLFKDLAEDLRKRNDDSGFARVAEKISLLFGNDAQKVFSRFTPEEPTAAAPPTPEEPASPAISIAIEKNVVVHEDIAEMAADEECHPPIEEIAEELIEDIQPIEDIEEIIEEAEEPGEEWQEWEEEIDLDAAETVVESSPVQQTVAVIEEEFPEFSFGDGEVDFATELEDIELEIETEEPQQDLQNLEAGSSLESDSDTFDLASELSLFANEIDFDLPRADGIQDDFDFTSPTGFKKGELDKEDTESHYSLGLAYREMGLYDEAIGEFTVAARAPERKVDCLILQGICFRDMGDIEKSVEILTGTLSLDGLNEDELLGIKYELAACREIQGDKNAAIELYSEILDIRPGFSDTAVKLSSLRNK